MANIYTQSEAENYLRNQQRYQELKQAYADKSNEYLSNYNEGIKSINEEYKTGKTDIANQYRSGLSQLGKSYSQQGAQIGRNFTQSMSEAFDVAQKQRSSFLSQSASIGSGQRQNIARDLDAATTNAYDSYIQNYMKNKQLLDTNIKSGSEELAANRDSAISQLETNAQNAKTNLAEELNKLVEQDNKEIESYEKELTKEAENFVSLANMPVEYLKYLWEKNPDLFNDDLLGRYTYLDKEGKRQLISGEQMSSSFFEHDEDGNVFLSPAGKEFYSIVAYGLGDTGAALGFNDYMSENYNDLYQWTTALNTYGDTEFVNSHGYSSNFDAVMGSLLGADVVASESYKAKSFDVGSKYNQNASDKIVGKGDDVNTIEVETVTSPAGKTVKSFTDADYYYLDSQAKDHTKAEMLEYKDIVDGKKETFVINMNDVEYKFQATKKNAELNILNDIKAAYGYIEELKIYNYDGIYYMGVRDENGNKVLRKLNLKGKKTNDALKELK